MKKANSLIEAAYLAIKGHEPTRPATDKEIKLVETRQLLRMASQAFTKASMVEHYAKEAQRGVLGLREEIRVRIQLLEDDLGLSKPPCEHENRDRDDRECPDCGKDLREEAACDHADSMRGVK